jgi:putative heme-binding domain-containing protein
MSFRVWLFVLPWLIGGLLTENRAADADETPHWIWRRDTSGDVGLGSNANAPCQFEHRFPLDARVLSATLRPAADFCQVTVAVNGRPLVNVEPYSATVEVDATAAMRHGENHVSVIAKSVGGPAALALSLHLVTADGQQRTVVTDGRWLTGANKPDRPAVSLGQVERTLWGLGRRSAAIAPFENYEQWRQALNQPGANNSASFWTAPGFEISLVRRAGPDEGSWVSLAFDSQGRITIAREDKGLLRMTLDADRNSIANVEVINDELQECRGLLYAYDALYANANNSKGLYRLRDNDRDDRFDEVKLLREFPGSVGHGRNDLALGPDGLIYSIHGDAVDLPTRDINDHTSPLREARRGQSTKEGYVLRTDRDGRQWELVCGGLRNPFGLAFNPASDLFTYDADAEFDMGTPWYRPTRIVQLLTGADYGWRGVTGKWPPYFADHPDNAPATLDIGRGSPTAVAFGTGTKFPEEYRRALFVLDWTYGRIVAVHLAPRGAGYRGQAETFLQGRPLNVTDLAVGPDGALHVVTGGRKTQSALYRIAYTGTLPPATEKSSHERACQQHAAAARSLRTGLERRHDDLRERLDFAWPHLDAADPILRHAARVAVERQPLAMWERRAMQEPRTTAALTALIAVARAGNQASNPALVERLLNFSARELDVGQTLALCHAYSLCWQHAPETVTSRREKIAAQLDAIFPHPAAQIRHVSPLGTGANVQRELARLLGQLDAPSVVPKTTTALLASDAQEDRLQGLLVLRRVRTGWTSETRRAYFTALNDGGKFVAGEGMPRFLSKLREEALATLSETERLELADLLQPASEATESEPPPRPVVKNWTLSDFASSLEGTGHRGSSARGALVFRDALCARCHRAGARGPAVGPDLTHVSGRFSRRDMLESILTPSKVVAENYRNVQVSTTDGRVLVGRVLVEGDYRSETLRLATEPLQPAAIVELNKRQIDQVRESETSPMPSGLLDSFQLEEILDLLAFLESGANVKPDGQSPQPASANP